MGIEHDQHFEVPSDWTTIVLNKWDSCHIAWFHNRQLTWQRDYYISDREEYQLDLYNTDRVIRMVYFYFKESTDAVLFSLQWANNETN